MLKKENGVTLVALVITIIVLLILAAVTLSMVMGDSGIFGKANKAAVATNIADAKDAVNMAIMEATANQYDNNGQIVSTTEVPAESDPMVNVKLTQENVVAAVNRFLEGYEITASTSPTATAVSIKKGTATIKDANGADLSVTITVNEDKHSATPAYTNDALEVTE